MSQLLYKRHPCTRQVAYLDSSASNPVWSGLTTAYAFGDIESVEISDTGGDIAAGTTSNIYVVKPRDWEFVQSCIYGSSTLTVPTYYTFLQAAATASSNVIQMWVASPPETAGTNSIRVVYYAVEKWVDSVGGPAFPTEFDSLLVLKTAHYLRLQKDLEVNDLLVKIAPLELKLMQAVMTPMPENDYQIPAAGRFNFRTKYATKGGWIRRY